MDARVKLSVDWWNDIISILRNVAAGEDDDEAGQQIDQYADSIYDQLIHEKWWR